MPIFWKGNRTVDIDVVTYLAASGLTGAINQAAVNFLVGGLKCYSLWAKMIAIYPLVGGTAALHKWNLKDPRDTDAAYRLLFNGGVIHDAIGITGNGMTGYADTKIVPNSVLSLNSCHVSAYSRTNGILAGPIMACSDVGTANRVSNYPRYTGNIGGVQIGSNTEINFTSLSGTGLWTASRTASNIIVGYRNDKQIVSGATSSIALPSYSLILLGFNNAGSLATPWGGTASAFTVGAGLSATDVLNLNRVIQNYQAILGRNVQ